MLSDRIREARRKANIRQYQLARMLGVAVSTLNKYERGHRVPDAALLNRIATLLNCDPGWLLSGRGPSAVPVPVPGAYNSRLMREIIQTVEELFARDQLTLPPIKKAELIDLLYDELQGAESVTEELRGKIIKFTRLAS